MKLRCQRSTLAAALQTVSGVVPTRTPKDILKNVKLQVGQGTAVLMGTDQEVGVRCNVVEVETESVGEALLPMQRLSSILREVTDEVIALEATEERLTFRSGHSEFQLSAADPAEFPDVPEFTDESYHAISCSSLKQAIQRTVFAADVESTRYALGGVLVDYEADRMTFAATDSRRLAVVRTSATLHGNPSAEQGQSVVPSKAMSLVERNLMQDDSEVRIALHDNDAVFQSGQTTIYCRLVQGRFPRYQDVIPQESPRQIDLVVGTFHSAVRQSMIVTSDESRGVDFRFGGGMLTLESSATDVGTSQVQLPISYDADEVVITFDPRFVADFLKVLEPASSLTLHLTDANSAAVFRADENYTYVVMPLARDD